MKFPNSINPLFSNGDEQQLLQKIKQGDKVALVQLTMQNLPYIESHIDRFEQRPFDIPTAEAVDILLAAFINAAEQYIDGTDFYDVSRASMNKAIRPLWENAPIKKRNSFNLHTPEHIAYLNKLNRFLIKKEWQIVNRATEYIELVKQRIKSKDAFTTDYNLGVEVSYFGKDETGEPIHIYTDHFHYDEKTGENRFGLLCDGEDWKEYYMPVLDEPYCYLLHDLIDHSRIGEKLYDIGEMWFDIKLDDQHCVDGRLALK